MTQDTIQAVTRACKRIDDPNGTATGHWRHGIGDVTADLIAKRVFDSFKARACEDAHTALVPILWSQPIEMNVIGVVKTVASLLFDFPELNELVSLFQTKQEVAVVLSVHILCCQGTAPHRLCWFWKLSSRQPPD